MLIAKVKVTKSNLVFNKINEMTNNKKRIFMIHIWVPFFGPS